MPLRGRALRRSRCPAVLPIHPPTRAASLPSASAMAHSHSLWPQSTLTCLCSTRPSKSYPPYTTPDQPPCNTCCHPLSSLPPSPPPQGTEGDYLSALRDTYAVPENVFTESNERVHGRLAMLGLGALILLELVAGRAIL